ncbi:MAG: hypothetical protein KHW95_04425 [Firmicutes bacterium]|nr:hypothetical protein [Bacillota bacterium]
MKNFLVKAFICVESALFLAFTAMDVLGTGDSRWLKFAGIALCFVVSALLSARGGEVLVTVAVGLSAAADILLLIMDAHYAVGVMLFFVAQILYFVRIYRANGHKSAWPLRLFLFMAAVAVMAQFGLLSPLDLLAGAYFSFFACNVMQASGLENKLFFAGLGLFLCCDICVGLHNMPSALPDWLQSAARIGMWTFYLPSQVMIVLSGKERDVYEKCE